mgnify:CR=1 FL=1
MLFLFAFLYFEGYLQFYLINILNLLNYQKKYLYKYVNDFKVNANTNGYIDVNNYLNGQSIKVNNVTFFKELIAISPCKSSPQHPNTEVLTFIFAKLAIIL